MVLDTPQAFMPSSGHGRWNCSPRRLHNVGAPVTSVLGTVFRGADLEAQLNVLVRRAGEALPTTSLADTHKKVGDFRLSKGETEPRLSITGPGWLRLLSAVGQA